MLQLPFDRILRYFTEFECGRVAGKFRGDGRFVFSVKDVIVEANDWPWMASLGYFEPDDPETGKWQHKCGASIVTRDHVVTAAHCAALVDKS